MKWIYMFGIILEGEKKPLSYNWKNTVVNF